MGPCYTATVDATTPPWLHPIQFNNDYVHGGSPYGPSTIAGGDGSRQPLEAELAYAKVGCVHFGAEEAQRSAATRCLRSQ